MTEPSAPLTLSQLKETYADTDLLRKGMRVDEAIKDLTEVSHILRSQWSDLNKNQVDAFRLRVEISRIRLAKFLPDIKATEHNVTTDNSKVRFVIDLGRDQAILESTPAENRSERVSDPAK